MTACHGPGKMAVMQQDRDVRDELRATIDARRDLGPEYEPVLIDSLADRLDATIAARVEAELKRRGKEAKRKSDGPRSMVPIALGSLGIGVPLTAIASSAGTVGLIVAWLSIVLINIAAAAALMRRP
jgi:anti-sigma factor RsiW